MELLRIPRQIHCKAVEQTATLIHRQYNRDWETSYSRPPIDPYLTSPLLQNAGGTTEYNGEYGNVLLKNSLSHRRLLLSLPACLGIVYCVGSVNSPLSSFVTHSLFHCRRETFLFCKSFAPQPSFSSSGLTPRISRTAYRYSMDIRFLFFLRFSVFWHCSLHYLFLQATPLFPHCVTIVC